MPIRFIAFRANDAASELALLRWLFTAPLGLVVFQNDLHRVKGSPIDDSRMRTFHEHPGKLTVVPKYFLFQMVVDKRFLQERITRIFLVTENCVQGCRAPFSPKNSPLSATSTTLENTS